MSNLQNRVKCLLLGDAYVGKRELAGRCNTETPPGRILRRDDYFPNFELYRVSTSISNHSPWDDSVAQEKDKQTEELIAIQMQMWILHPIIDQHSPDDRDTAFGGVRVFGICYNITKKESLETAIHKVRIRFYFPSLLY